jgi:hypothetical protein
MASSDPLPHLDDEVYVPTPFVARARFAALLWPALLLAAGLPGTRFLAGDAPDTLGGIFLSALAVGTALPTLPLFVVLPISSGVLVLALGAVTCLPVWAWGGAALARRVERGHGPDWSRWARWYLAFPLVAAAAALVFIGGLAPMGA